MSNSVKEALEKLDQKSLMSESEAAMWFYGNVAPAPRNPMPTKPATAPDFKAYRHDAIKDALNEIFDGHCAYCESRYAHVVKMDVEHYRPKGAVVEDDGTKKKPGYYWLAATWENLLPSCNLCNRANTQDLAQADGSIISQTRGKANFFPLFPGTVRAIKKGDEQHEDPLLLDPCNPDHDPGKHLLFRSDGLVEPRNSIEEQARPRGMATIEVCALHRATLVEARRVEAVRIRDAMAGILRAECRCLRAPTDEIAKDELADEENELEVLLTDLSFQAMATELRALFDAVRQGIVGYYAALHVWEAEKTLGTQQNLKNQARKLSETYAQAGLHRPFVKELLKVARIPLAGLAD